MMYMPFDDLPGVKEGRQIVNQAVDELLREQTQELERQAAIFLKMGFVTSELTIVCLPDGSREVAPECAL